MSDEKLRIMQMIRDGKITPEEGLELLDALNPPESAVVQQHGEIYKIKTRLDDSSPDEPSEFRPGDDDTSESFEDDQPGTGKKPKWLYIQVNEEDGKNVNIKIPIGLARFVNKFIPSEARKEMKEQGVDLDIGGLMDELQKHGDLDLVNIDEGDGKTVRIFTK